jgi:hypothetical protein
LSFAVALIIFTLYVISNFIPIFFNDQADAISFYLSQPGNEQLKTNTINNLQGFIDQNKNTMDQATTDRNNNNLRLLFTNGPGIYVAILGFLFLCYLLYIAFRKRNEIKELRWFHYGFFVLGLLSFSVELYIFFTLIYFWKYESNLSLLTTFMGSSS